MRAAIAIGAVAAAIVLATANARALPPSGVMPRETATPKAAMSSSGTMTVPPQPHFTTNYATCISAGADASTCGKLGTGIALMYWAYSCGGCYVDRFDVQRIGAPSIAAGRIANIAHVADLVVGAPHSAVPSTPPPAPKPFALVGNPSGACFDVVAVHDGAVTGPSPQVCVAAASRVVTIPASTIRVWAHSYGVKPPGQASQSTKVETALPNVVGMSVYGDRSNGVATFHRAAFGFDRTPIGKATIFSGSFGYTVAPIDFDGVNQHSIPAACGTLYAAPAGWQGAQTAPLPAGGVVGNLAATGAGGIVTAPLDSLLHGWENGTIAFLILESPQAENVQYEFSGPSPKCPAFASVYLTLTVGVDG